MIVKGIFLIVVENAWQNKNGRQRREKLGVSGGIIPREIFK